MSTDTLPAAAKTSDLVIRDADHADIAAITAIYGHHVLTGTASFEELPPSETEITNRFEAIRGYGLPYLVALRGDEVVGYC